MGSEWEWGALGKADACPWRDGLALGEGPFQFKLPRRPDAQ